MNGKTVITCAVTGVLTDPARFNVPVTPTEMADAARQAYDQGASVVHLHFRAQEPGMGMLPTWDVEVVGEILSAIKAAAPDMIICMSTGVVGPDISGPAACLEAFKPEMAACNAGSLNYLKIRQDGSWAWPPILFDNPVEKINGFLEVMNSHGIVPEFECFDLGIVRSVGMFRRNGMFEGTAHVSFVMGVASGMPARADLLPILVDELPEDACWQTIATGDNPKRIWEVLRRTVELGGNVRTGLEDTFYLPSGEKVYENGRLVEALADIARESGKEPATPSEARRMMALPER
ncbi:MAG: 3-keto-5-aminohexanoate cleavage protein [Desulfococcus sp. 4484_241]|nr:MAG: 3-keto-5-aminohexanoate cleavage protein [Desulfococcus sp. 4484_241]